MLLDPVRFSGPFGVAALVGLVLSASPALAVQQPREPMRGQATIVAGDHYFIGEERFALSRRVGDLAVRFQDRTDASASVAALLGRGGDLEGFEEIARLAPDLRMFRSPALADSAPEAALQAYQILEDKLSRLRARFDVRFAVPVFVNEAYGTYAVATDEILVRLKDGVDVDAFFRDARFSAYRRGNSVDAFVALVAAGAGVPALALSAELRGDQRVLWAEPNFYQERRRLFSPNDTLYALQWHLNNTGQSGGTPGADARLAEAWALEPGGSVDMVIAVIDDGIELSHPDLRIFVNAGEVADGTDSDGNGYVDDLNGWDFTGGGGGDNNPGPDSSLDEHGTAVAGIAAARGDNGIGVAGASYNAAILPVRAFDGPVATSDLRLASALAYASGRGRTSGDSNWRGADIVNNSWGGGPPSSVINEALTWAAENGRGGLGTPHFFGTGSSSASSIEQPAAQSGTIASVIAVGASTHFDVRAYYSQFGPQLDFVAPSSGEGARTVTTDRLGSHGYNGLSDLDYTNQFFGTSSASPLAAGVAGLLLSREPKLTVSQLRQLMRVTADKIGPHAYDASGFHHEYGYGRINAARAVAVVGTAALSVTGPLGALDNADEVLLEAAAGEVLTVIIKLTAIGTEPLLLGTPGYSGNAEFELTESFEPTTLDLGESASFTIEAGSVEPGQYAGQVAFSTNVDGDESFAVGFVLDVVPASVGGQVFEDWNGDGERAPGDPLIKGVIVWLDMDEDGARELPEPQSPASADPELPFGASPTLVTSSVDVSGLPSPLFEATVRVNIDHTQVGDVRARLIGPSGQAIVLMSEPGGEFNWGDDFVDTVFDDSAATSIQNITAVGAPYTGEFRPAEPLSSFAGSDPNGIWTLEVSDHRPSTNDGVLRDWELRITSGGEPFSETDEYGAYRFVELAPGTYHVRAEMPEGWNPSQPEGGVQVVEVEDASSNSLGFDFGLYRRSALYGTVGIDAEGAGNPPADAPPAAGILAFLDIDEDGELADPETSTELSEPDVTIPDDRPLGVSDSITVGSTGTEAEVLKVTVGINITHARVGDLIVRLQSPSGQQITLVDRRGGNGGNLTDTVFDDDASVSISDVTSEDAPFTGSFRPEQALSAFIKTQAAGNWTLNVSDNDRFVTGRLVDWTLVLQFAPEPTEETDGFGQFRFDGANYPGMYTLRLDVQHPLFVTAPQSGTYEVQFNSEDAVQNLDFAVGIQNAVFSDGFEGG